MCCYMSMIIYSITSVSMYDIDYLLYMNMYVWYYIPCRTVYDIFLIHTVDIYIHAYIYMIIFWVFKNLS